MKRLFALGLAVAMLLVSATGCGKKAEKKKAAVSSNTMLQAGDTNLTWAEVKAKMPKDLGKKIVFYNWNEANSMPGAEKAMENFTKETGIEIEWKTAAYRDYSTELAAMITTNNSPDIVRLRCQDPAVMPYLTPLTDYGYDFTDQAWDHNAMYHYMFNNKPYAAVLKNTPYFQPSVMYYNRDLVGRFNMEDPYKLWKAGQWTYDKLATMCVKFAKTAGSQYTAITTINAGYTNTIGASFTKYNPEKNKFESGMDSKDLLTAWQWTAQLKAKGVIAEKDIDYDGFDNGLILFYTDSLIAARTTHFYAKPVKAQGNLGVVPLPSITGVEYKVNLSENEAYAIPQGAKNPKAVPYFLRYWLSAENYDMNKFYCDAQAKEVADYLKTQKYTMNADAWINKEVHGANSIEIGMALRNSDPAQVKTVIDSYKPVIDTFVQMSNEKIAEMN